MNISHKSVNDLYNNFNSKSVNAGIKFPQKNEIQIEKSLINIPVTATTTLGTILPFLIIRKYQGKTLEKAALQGMDFISKAKTVLKSYNIEYGLKEMLLTSFGSIAGGLSGGILFNKEESKKAKIKESVFQFANIAIPTSIVAGLLKFTDKSKNFKGVLPKIASVIMGIGVGMPIASFLSNELNNSIIDKSNQNKRKICLKDCFVHIDDLVGALALAKIPFADKLHVDKILPVFYGLCGYEAGTKK